LREKYLVIFLINFVGENMAETKNFFSMITTFFKEAYVELKKVSWLNRKEVIASTIVVIVMIMIIAIYVGIVDFVLSRIVSFLLGGRV
jgi:preprotein translocase subunit SecE